MATINCKTCKNLDPSRFEVVGQKERTWQFIPRRPLAISQSAIRGCSGCKIIERASEVGAGSDSLLQHASNVLVGKNAGEKSMKVSRRGQLYGSDVLDYAHIYNARGSTASETWPCTGSLQRLSHDLVSETLTVSKEWLTECLENYLLCGGIENSLLPKRVIYVGEAEPRLIQTGGISGVYATLSHCRGTTAGTSPIAATKQTLAEPLAGIPFYNLPKCFQYAVDVTRQLGLEFLWIDSLCNLQN